MPDISKLEDLCNILEISVDELLGVETKASSGAKKFIQNEELTFEEIAEVASIMPPKEVKAQMAGAKKKAKRLSFAELAKLAEHIDEDFLLSVIEADTEPITDTEGLFELIEYLPEEAIANIVSRVVPEKLPELADCLEDFGDGAQDTYMARCIEAGQLQVLLDNAEFLSRENLDFLIDFFINIGKADELSEIYPYLEEYQLCRIIRALIEYGAEEKKISEVHDYI